MPQFFINTSNIKENHIELTQTPDIKHILEVLRHKIGDIIIFIDEKEIVYKAKLEELSKNFLKAKIIEQNKSIRTLTTNITLIQSVLKSNAQDFAIQKATELGVKKIQPIISDFTVIKFKNDKDKLKKIERWQKIANESCKQCERSQKPKVLNIKYLKELSKENFEIIIACVERCDETTLKEFLRKNIRKKDKNIAIIIGPEGGWSDKEIKFFTEQNIPKVSLGNMILRAETAVINALSGVIYEYED